MNPALLLPSDDVSALADLWVRTCERLATEMPEQQFNTWIRPLPAAECQSQDGQLGLRLAVPNRFK
ncbi:MAG: DnaA N-terminal domain-containing protein, partial [Inhella sp.]